MSSAVVTPAPAVMAATAIAGEAPCWCHRCSRFVRVRAREVIVCPDSDTGFVGLVELPGRHFSSPTTSGEPTRPQRHHFATPPMYVITGPSTPRVPSRANHPRSRRTANGSRPAFNPVIVLRRGGGASNAGPGGGAPAVELSYDGGLGPRPLPTIMSDFLMGSAFSRFLEQLADMEGSEVVRRGSDQPPASKAAVESMPTIRIAQDHILVDAHCGVCQDPFELGTEAREMPCKHVYHEDCILPWLSLRNSCPVCRHEMPVDVRSGRGDMGSNGDEEDAVGLTIWRLPGGGLAVGRFSGGRRARGTELPVVHTEVDAYRDDHSRESRGIGRMFRSFLSFLGCASGSRPPSSLRSTGAASRSCSSSSPTGHAG